MIKIDFHTHSQASPDGWLRPADYSGALKQGLLDYIVISDHNRINFALEQQRELGERIIVGEEITSTAGEIIGLYLSEVVPAGLSPAATVAAIHGQGGLVYIPHPFETVRKGVTMATLTGIAADVDIIEVRNGRAVLQNRGPVAEQWAAEHGVAQAASSDAHGPSGWGRTHTVLPERPTRANLVELLKRPETQRVYGWIGVHGLAYPKLNRVRKRLVRP